MKCPNCNTINPDNAQFCRNCGMNLNQTDIPEEEIVHVPTVETDDDYQKANTDSGNDGRLSDWTSCCICLVIIFIAIAIFSFH